MAGRPGSLFHAGLANPCLQRHPTTWRVQFKSNRFARIPEHSLKANLSLQAHLVLIAISLHAGPDGWAWPSLETIAAMTGIIRNNVSRVIAESRGCRPDSPHTRQGRARQLDPLSDRQHLPEYLLSENSISTDAL